LIYIEQRCINYF